MQWFYYNISTQKGSFHERFLQDINRLIYPMRWFELALILSFLYLLASNSNFKQVTQKKPSIITLWTNWYEYIPFSEQKLVNNRVYATNNSLKEQNTTWATTNLNYLQTGIGQHRCNFIQAGFDHHYYIYSRIQPSTLLTHKI